MLTRRRRLAALWRAALAADAPLGRRMWGLLVALLPLPARRWISRMTARLPPAPRWLARAACDIGGYLLMCTIVAFVLLMWKLIGSLFTAND